MRAGGLRAEGVQDRDAENRQQQYAAPDSQARPTHAFPWRSNTDQNTEFKSKYINYIILRKNNNIGN